MSPALLVSHAALRIPLPLFVASAGAGGAMLTITLLHPTELILEPGRVLVVHDPLGLTADRLLAHVYREVAHRNAAAAEPGVPAATTLRWLIARPPLARVWDAVDALGRRSWRRAPGRSPAGAHSNGTPLRSTLAPRASRVAEARAQRTTGHRETVPAVLMVSEAERPDALSPESAARLLARAVRRDWAVLAATREGPITTRTCDGPEAFDRRAPSGNASTRAVQRTTREISTARDWCTHVVCQGGVLRPVAPR